MKVTNKVQVYAISGWKGHGKDKFAKTIVEYNPSFVITHFADPLKQMTMKVFGLTYDQVYDNVLKEQPLEAPIALDDYLEAMQDVTGLKLQPSNMVAISPRKVLQYFGTDYVRLVQPTYWTDKVLEFTKEHEKVLIPDCRFLNEAAAIRSIRGSVIKVVRLDLPPSADMHPSEQEVAKITPDLLVGKMSKDLSLQDKVAELIAENRVLEAFVLYDYRQILSFFNIYYSGQLDRELDDFDKYFLSYYEGCPDLVSLNAEKVAV